MRDRAAIERGRHFTPPMTYLRRPARCGRPSRVAPPSVRFPAEVVRPSIELPLVYDFLPIENFLSTLLIFAVSVGTKLYIPCTYVKTTVRWVVIPTTIFRKGKNLGFWLL